MSLIEKGYVEDVEIAKVVCGLDDESLKDAELVMDWAKTNYLNTLKQIEEIEKEKSAKEVIPAMNEKEVIDVCI